MKLIEGVGILWPVALWIERVGVVTALGAADRGHQHAADSAGGGAKAPA